jgi:5-methylcytosine-specific restriction endonuclease McrA
MPKSRGGADSWENLTTACNECNVRKGNQTPEEAGMPLRTKPYRPVHITFFQNLIGTIQENWKPYLYM